MVRERKLPRLSEIDTWWQRRMRRPLGRSALIHLADDYFKESFHVPDAEYSIADHYSLGARAINCMNAAIFHAYAVRRFRKETTIIEPHKNDNDLDGYVRRRRDVAIAEMYAGIPLGNDRKYKKE